MGFHSRSWGPIAPLLARRTIALEHESRPPSWSKLATAMTKLCWVVESYWLDRDARRDERVPLLLLIVEGVPRWFHEANFEIPSGWIEGVWYARRDALGDVLVVAPRALPEGPGVALLKAMPGPGLGPSRRRAETWSD